MRIAVFGDLIEDIYIYGTCDRLNPEGPAPLITHKQTIKRVGGAGNVAENLKSLGLDVDCFYPPGEPSRKTRIITDNATICRYDQDVISDVVQIPDQITHDLVVVSDYNKGSIGDLGEVIARTPAQVFVDPKRPFHNYQGAYCIKPNKLEFEKFYGAVSAENLIKLAKENNHELVIVTLGRAGVMYYYENQVHTIPAISNTVADVTGAGDCFLAALVYGFAHGRGVHDCVKLGNLGAGRSVQQHGTYVLTKRDLIKKKVFTNGCFDILHRGHIELLEKSSRLGDYLIVGLNSDASVQRLKGKNRPVNKQEDRKKALESLRFVDEVIVFDEDTPYQLIKKLQPDIITKGGDYEASKVVGADLAQVQIIPFVDGYSTTAILNKRSAT